MYDSVVPMDRGTAFSTPQYQGLSGKSRDILMKINLGQKVSNREIRHLRGAMWVANGGNLGPEFARRASSIDPISHLRESQAAGLERARLGARQDAMYGDGASESPTLQALNRDALIAEARQRSLAEDVAAMRRDEMQKEAEENEWRRRNILPIERGIAQNNARLGLEQSRSALANYGKNLAREERLADLKFQNAEQGEQFKMWQNREAVKNQARVDQNRDAEFKASRDWFGQSGIDDGGYGNNLFTSGAKDAAIAYVKALQKQNAFFEERRAVAEEKSAIAAKENMIKTYYNILKNLQEKNDKLSPDSGKRSKEELIAEANNWMDVIYQGAWSGATQGANPQVGGTANVSNEIYQNALAVVKSVPRKEGENYLRKLVEEGKLTMDKAVSIVDSLAKGK